MECDPSQGASSAESRRDNAAAYERRREQVRRAQKIHRGRKAAYVSALEREVEELRAWLAAEFGDTVEMV